MATSVYVELSNPDASWIMLFMWFTELCQRFIRLHITIIYVAFLLITHFNHHPFHHQSAQTSLGCQWIDNYIYFHEKSASQHQKVKRIVNNTHHFSEPNVQEGTVLAGNRRNELGHHGWVQNTFADRRTWCWILLIKLPTSRWLWRCYNICKISGSGDKDTKAGPSTKSKIKMRKPCNLVIVTVYWPPSSIMDTMCSLIV